MAREVKEKYVVLAPKNDEGKKRLDYHGDRWILRGETATLQYVREVGPWLILISRDGKKCLHVKKKDDKDFDVRPL